MPEIKVLIKWDTPKEEDWFNVFNLQHALRQVCTNTHFEITDLESGVCATIDGGGEKRELLGKNVNTEKEVIV